MSVSPPLSAALPPTVSSAALDDFAVVRATGDDAVAFLHGQLTQDIAGLDRDARFAGYCSAKGRLMATMAVWRAPQADEGGGLFLLVRRDIADALVKRLSLFVLRAKVRLAVAPAHAQGIWTGEAGVPELEAAVGPLPRTAWQRADLPSGTWIAAPCASAACARWWRIAEGDAPPAGEAARWRADDLAAGLAWIGAATQDLFIPQTVNLDLAGGVSFTKGCYPGQEIVARSHYRGTVKRRTAFGRLAGAAAHGPAPGTDVYDAARPDEPCGRLVDASGPDGAALLFEVTLASLPDGDLRLGAPDGPRIEVLPLPYALAA